MARYTKEDFDQKTDRENDTAGLSVSLESAISRREGKRRLATHTNRKPASAVTKFVLLVSCPDSGSSPVELLPIELPASRL